MSSRLARNRDVPALPPLLTRIIHAARYAPYAPLSRTGHDAAVETLGQWALLRVISKGVLAPDDQAAYEAIQDVATRYLGLAKASEAFSKALRLLNRWRSLTKSRTAHNQLQSVSDDAHYYARWCVASRSRI